MVLASASVKRAALELSCICKWGIWGALKIRPTLLNPARRSSCSWRREKAGSGRESETGEGMHGCPLDPLSISQWLPSLPCCVQKARVYVLPLTLRTGRVITKFSQLWKACPTTPLKTMTVPQGSWGPEVIWCICGLKWPWESPWNEKPIAKTRLRHLCRFRKARTCCCMEGWDPCVSRIW